MIYFLGCPHIGHRNIAKFRSFITNTRENDDMFLAQYKKHITKRDIVYFLGDAAFSFDGLRLIADLPGRKILIKGNHDDMVSTLDQSRVFEEIYGMLKYKGLWLSHAPIHPDELRGKPNVHAHVHKATIMKKTWYGKKYPDPRYYNASVDVLYPSTGSWFASLDQVRTYFGRKIN